MTLEEVYIKAGSKFPFKAKVKNLDGSYSIYTFEYKTSNGFCSKDAGAYKIDQNWELYEEECSK
jgi:hypothetical protein